MFEISLALFIHLFESRPSASLVPFSFHGLIRSLERLVRIFFFHWTVEKSRQLFIGLRLIGARPAALPLMKTPISCVETSDTLCYYRRRTISIRVERPIVYVMSRKFSSFVNNHRVRLIFFFLPKENLKTGNQQKGYGTFHPLTVVISLMKWHSREKEIVERKQITKRMARHR